MNKLYFLSLVVFFSCTTNSNSVEETPNVTGRVVFQTNDAPGDVTRIDGLLKRNGFADLSFSYEVSSGTGSVALENLEAGQWFVYAEAFNAEDLKTYEGNKSVTIIAGETTDVSLALKPVDADNTGHIGITFSYGLRVNRPEVYVSGTSVQLDYTTNLVASGTVFYRSGSSGSYSDIIVANLGFSQTVQIENLTSGTQYQAYAVAETSTESANSVTVYFTTSDQRPTDLIISEYVEGSSNNKALEIYNPTMDTLDIADYAIAYFSNGSPSVSNAFLASTGTKIAPHATFLLVNSQAGEPLLSLADATSSSVCDFTGNDALAIITRSSYDSGVYVYVDIFGKIGEDPGSAWINGTHSSQDKTLRRVDVVTGGIVSNPQFFDPQAEWKVFDQNTFDGLGQR